MYSKEEILEKLSSIKYPGFGKSIVDFKFVKEAISDNEGIKITIDIPSSSQDIQKELEIGIHDLFEGENLKLNINTPKIEKETPKQPEKKNIAPTIKNFVMVSSGKGGVGKSTTSLNLAIALASNGKKVGLLDADIYGPNIPRMMALEGVKPQIDSNKKIIPLEAYGIKMVSMGSLIKSGQALIWRGAMVMKVITQLLRDINWGELDILVIDMPPGTGDAQLTLAQSVPVTLGICVTTPQVVSLDDTSRSLDMFKKLNINVAGIVENMSGFLCPDNGKTYDIFGRGTTDEIAQMYKTEVLAHIPIEIDTRIGGDEGKPIMYFNPSCASSKEYIKIANSVISKLEVIEKDGGVDNASIQPS
ncbi:MAG: putative ATP/GTP-binding protein (mrp protein homolog) [uncultured Campylobacterales bacterium]|uniref:Iron-sulfur cluster carrier protein n=1 Tax=uncultured Campylobacterales bacterium TaxID=352960 RepID=A0A6S6T3Q4_9BACT|nr:MAG: putative ATP/GTP-binding protein (mrp protein homolog) [uncultured Campylobacterales bacterium]